MHRSEPTKRDVGVAIVGGGILGCATAAYLAEAGHDVALFERDTVGAGASGRNSGAFEHPYDAAQRPLYEQSLGLLRALGTDMGGDEPAGVLLLDRERAVAERVGGELAAAHPELEPRVLEPAAVVVEEPAAAPGLWGCLLRTGRTVEPGAATRAFAARARAAGAALHERTAATPIVEGGRCVGVALRTAYRGAPADTAPAGDGPAADAAARAASSAAALADAASPVAAAAGAASPDAAAAGAAAGGTPVGDPLRAAHTVVAAGAASCSLVDPRWTAVTALWGAVLELAVPVEPRRVLLEGAIVKAQGGRGDVEDGVAFSLVPAPGGRATLGSSFAATEPDPAALEPALRDRGAPFVPAVADAPATARRACARPRSADGRPLLGRVAGVEGLWIATGHGGRGITTGAASARLLADAIAAGTDDAIPPPLRASRFPLPTAVD